MPTAEYLREWKTKNLERVLAYNKKYRESNPEKIKFLQKESYLRWYSKNREVIREKSKLSMREYRKTSQFKIAQRKRQLRYKAKLDTQNIAIAGRPKPDHCELCALPAKVVFDHCHVGGHFRGWLCQRCNRTLGQVKDSIPLLCEMISYLERNKEA